MKLHLFPPGPFPRRVWIYAALRGIAGIEPVEYSFFDDSMQGEDFKVRNPGRSLPFLEIDGQNVYESITILRYLEETQPGHPLLGVSEYERRLVDTQIILCDDFYYALQLSVYSTSPYASRMGPQSHDIDMVTAPFWRMRLEQITDLMGGNLFLAGAAPTAADCVLYPMVDFLRLYGWVIPYHLHPLRRWFDRFAALDAVEPYELPPNYAENFISVAGHRV